MVAEVVHQFRERYGREPLVIAAPGRINLIGEHTDYNNGFVLPGAVDKHIYVAVAKRVDNRVCVYASRFDEKAEFTLETATARSGWVNYLIGVVFFLRRSGYVLSGVDVLVDGDLPVGSGMSSSAALSAGLGFALTRLFGLPCTLQELARIAQQTEHDFAGVNCGIMDPFVILHGKAGQVIRLDCRSLEFNYIPFHFPQYRIVLVNTLVHHHLASSEYNIRRQQCEAGVRLIQQTAPQIHSLRDLSLPELQRYQQFMDPVVFQRCAYVIQENIRLGQGCEALQQGDLSAFGRLMLASHEGLSRDYEVSCAELDFLVDASRNIAGVLGSRMMGGGFGGCTINLVHQDQVNSFQQKISEAYERKFLRMPEIYVMQLGDGVVEVSR